MKMAMSRATVNAQWDAMLCEACGAKDAAMRYCHLSRSSKGILSTPQDSLPCSLIFAYMRCTLESLYHESAHVMQDKPGQGRIRGPNKG